MVVFEPVAVPTTVCVEGPEHMVVALGPQTVGIPPPKSKVMGNVNEVQESVVSAVNIEMFSRSPRITVIPCWCRNGIKINSRS